MLSNKQNVQHYNIFLEPWLFVILLKRIHDPVTFKMRSRSRPPRRHISTELQGLRTEQRYSPLLHHLNGRFVVNHSGLVTLTVGLNSGKRAQDQTYSQNAVSKAGTH